MEAPRKTPRFWVAVQPTIVRLYKAAGLVALTAILIGLVGFLVVNIFYFFDHTWVKPVVLSPTHQKVVEAETQLADARMQQSQLVAERASIESQIAEIDRTVAADKKYVAEIGTAAAAPKTPEQWSLHLSVEKLELDQANQAGRRAPLEAREKGLDLRIKDEDALVQRLSESPYLRAVNGKVVLAFVPYTNLSNIKPQTKLYACRWGLVWCHVVGRITGTIDGEVQDTHPHDESIQRGIMVEVDLNTPSAAGENVLFAGSKPLWFL